jgi:hypothetical protein
MLRFAQYIATIGTASAAIGSDYGWNYQRVYEEDSSCEDEQGTFHGCFLLVIANWSVIISWAQGQMQRVCKPSSVRNS